MDNQVRKVLEHKEALQDQLAYVHTHFSSLLSKEIKEGQIKEGRVISRVGSVPWSYGNHHHYRIDVRPPGASKSNVVTECGWLWVSRPIT